MGCSAETPSGAPERAPQPASANGARAIDRIGASALPVTVTRSDSETAVDAPSQTFTLRFSGQELELELARNDALLAADYKTFEVGADGALSERQPSQRAPFCHLTGKVVESDGTVSGSVWLTSCDAEGHAAFSALIVASGGFIELRPASAGARQYEIVRVERPSFIDDPTIDDSTPRLPRQPDSLLAPQATTPTGPGGQAWIENVIVNDALRRAAFASVNAVELNSLAITNMQAGLYYGSVLAPPVRLGVVAQVTFATDPYTPTAVGSEVDSGDLLQKFADWGASAALPNHDHRQLLSGFNFNGATVGLSYVGAMCNHSTSSSIVQVLNTAPLTAIVAAHEMGHSLGMPHDEPAGCASGFIMSASVCGSCPTQPTNFSSCSQAAYAAFLTPNVTCLSNPITTTYRGPTCGNGIVEAGETCDCGASNCQGKDACCNGSTCQLTPSATCSANDLCCDPQQCRPRAVGTPCRAAASACDTAEVCNGSAQCPSDGYLRAGSSCSDPLSTSAVCYQGNCRSREQQCSALEAEYSLGALVPCDSQSCGALLCRQVSTGVCYSLPGNFADGTPCGAGTQCSAGACVSSASLDPPARAAPALSPSAQRAMPLLLLVLGMAALGRRKQRDART